VIDPETGKPDSSAEITEIRAPPIRCRSSTQRVIPSVGGQPNNVIFLTPMRSACCRRSQS